MLNFNEFQKLNKPAAAPKIKNVAVTKSKKEDDTKEDRSTKTLSPPKGKGAK